MKEKAFFERIEGQLVVSCQALEDEPLHGSEHMARMAVAAESGGATAIRANGFADIQAIKAVTKLPIIGLVKQKYQNSDVYITPTKKEVDLLLKAGVDVIAIDATNRERPGREMLEELITYIKSKDTIVMADVSTSDEGVAAEKIGADCVGTTLSGYTDYSPQLTGPDFRLVKRLAERISVPIVAEGRYWTPDEAVHALEIGAFAVVVGSAITRPQIITKRFTDQLKKAGVQHGAKVVGGEFIKRHS
ncbi:N-acetylmannosamine-6-phosphate 2-epimerase [Pseudalkalibacillus hwajinpoensis]|uniref:N-acetylmannosamine-6-phosphate 2-epimerase n=1 Tax=Guptibacillus hwajinpoensis TaxID=208199 RepID=UPI00384C5D2B